MGSPPGVVVPEHSVTDREGRHGRADGVDVSGKLVAEDRHAWPQ